MDVTREVLTAARAPNSEGTAAPINRLAKMPHYMSPYLTNVVQDTICAAALLDGDGNRLGRLLCDGAGSTSTRMVLSAPSSRRSIPLTPTPPE
jgi:hypothetical protein